MKIKKRLDPIKPTATTSPTSYTSSHAFSQTLPSILPSTLLIPQELTPPTTPVSRIPTIESFTNQQDKPEKIPSFLNASHSSTSTKDERFKDNTWLKVYIGTWNMHGRLPHQDVDLSGFLPTSNLYDIIVIGSEECEQTIEASLLTPFFQPKNWIARIKSRIGNQYTMVAQSTLVAIHCCVFVRKDLIPSVHNIESTKVATGFGNMVGNKGGIGISFVVGQTSFLFINSHLAAHPHNCNERNAAYHKINAKMSLGMRKTRVSSSPQQRSSSFPTGHRQPHNTIDISAHSTKTKQVEDENSEHSNRQFVINRFDRVFWFGDLNYRIDGNRKVVDAIIKQNMFEVLMANDQLKRAQRHRRAFAEFVESEITFAPTYKIDPVMEPTSSIHQLSNGSLSTDNSTEGTVPNDVDSLPIVYDTSKKARVPSYTDRILWKPSSAICCEKYSSVTSIRCSDHFPVTAIFSVCIDGIR